MAEKQLSQRILDVIKPPKAGTMELWDTVERGLHIRISSTGSRSWFVAYRIGGKQKRLKIGDGRRMPLNEARAAASNALTLADQGKDPAAQKAAAGTGEKTVKAVFERYFAKHCEKKLARRSCDEIERTFHRRIFPAFGDKPLSDVTRADVRELVDSIADDGMGVLANRVLSRFKAFVNWAISQDYVESNVAEKINPPAKETARDRALTDNEVIRFLQATAQLDYPFGPWARMLLLTGQRRAETAAMEWSEIDARARTWTIPKEKSKNGQAHVVHLSPEAWAILEQIKADRPAGRYVFSTTDKTPVSGYSRGKARLNELMADVPPFTWHDLRRTCATIMAQTLAIPPHVVDKVLNHSPRSATGVGHIYNRAQYLPERRDALNKLGEYLSTLEARAESRNVVELRPRA